MIGEDTDCEMIKKARTEGITKNEGLVEISWNDRMSEGIRSWKVSGSNTKDIIDCKWNPHSRQVTGAMTSQDSWEERS